MIKKILSLMIITILALFIVGCQQMSKESATGSVPAPQAIPQQIVAPTEIEVPEVASTDKISILGKNGFDPAEISIKKGDKLVWSNDDAQKKGMVLNFKKGSTAWSRVVVSGLIKYGETYEKTFDETGKYEYWTTAYGVKAKITVTE